MDGDGQGMLAIVQSLRDAGLVVTVVDGKHGGNSASAVLAINMNSRPRERRSLGINTKFKPTHHCSTQANDARFASVYQLSHCGLKPTSPSVHLPEFPPQRAVPHPTGGNFEVSGWRNSECQYTPVRTTLSCRGSAYRWSKDTSAFVHSLRKYPNLSPNRSLSTELVQRLLTYSQNKNFSKSSYHTKHVRTTKTPSPDIQPSECCETSSKNVQTYTRTKHKRVDKSNTAYQIKYQGKQNYPSEKSRHSLNDKRLSNKYDYLKRTKPRGWNTRGTEVRYLTDVTKCIKDAIRNICDEAPVVCPKVQSRYSHHRRMHHLQPDGQQSTSANNNTNGEAPSPSERPCNMAGCGSPNNVCPRIRTRYGHHKKLQYSGQKSCSDLKNVEIQACPAPVPREAVMVTTCESSTSLSLICPAAVKICYFCKRPVPCHCKSEIDQRIEKEVLEWIKEIPVYSDDTKENKYLRNILSKKLVVNLQKIIKDGDFGKIYEEIDKCLNVLPMWCPESDKDKTIFKNQMAENLMNRLKQFIEKYFFKEQILLWFNELPFRDQIRVGDKDKFVDNLVSRLNAIERLSNDVDYKDALRNEIVKTLDEIPGIGKDGIIRMANKLADNLVPTDKKEMAQDDEIHKNICEWINNTPEFTENGFFVKDNTRLIDDLSKTLTEQQKKDSDSEKVKTLMIKDIQDWLQNACNNKKYFMDINTKRKLAQHLINKINPNNIKTPEDQKYIESIFDWLKDIPELSHGLNENILVEELAQILQELKNKGYDDDALLGAIVGWINKLCRKYDIDIDPKTIRKFAENFIDKLKLRQPKPLKLTENFQETIADEISHILEDDTITLTNKVKKNLQNKITNILTNSIDNILSNETAKTNRDLIKLLQHEGNMTIKEAKVLAKTVINSTKTMPLTEEQKKTPTKSVPFQPKKDVKRGNKEIDVDVLDKTDIQNKEEIEETISDLLPDEIIRGKKGEIMKDDIYNFFDDARAEKQVDDTLSRLVKRQREISLEPASPDYSKHTTQKHHRSAVSTPMQKDDVRKYLEKAIFAFMDDISVDRSPKTTENMRSAAKDCVNNVSQLLQINYDKKSVHKEVLDFLNSVPISSDTTRRELADELTNRLLSAGIQTSTPRKDLSFQPRRLTFESSISLVNFSDESQQTKQPVTEEDKYRKDLTQTVKNWLDSLPLGLNENESKRFKEIVINDLVGDMIDRQKYLQLNPGATSSDIEELENLKYQVFRWLNKIMDERDFDIVMPQTETLMDSVRRITVPKLVKPSGTRKDVKQSQGQLPDYIDALQDEISIWVEKIPNHLHQYRDKKKHEQMVQELAKNLERVGSNNVESEIKKWIQNNFRYSDQADITKVAQDLKKKLTSKGFSKDVSWVLQQDSSEFIEENLHGGILNWLKESPYYKSRGSHDRNTQEKIVAEMAKGLKNVFDTALASSEYVDTNILFIDEIAKHVKKFPMGVNKRSDEEFIKNIAANLLEHLKGLQMFQNISNRHTAISDDYLNSNIADWVESLPVTDKQNLATNSQFEALTKQFKEKLSDLRRRGNKKGMREEINKQLKLLPMDPLKQKDEKFMNTKVEELLKPIQTTQPENEPGSKYEDILLDIESRFSPKHGFNGAADILYENINKLCESLPIGKGKFHKDTEKIKSIKQNIGSKLMNKIEELNMNPEILNNDFLYKHILEDELDNLLSVLHPSPETEGSINNIKKNLGHKIKEAIENSRNEFAGKIYKQQLREKISNTLSQVQDVSLDEQTSFEVVIDKVADAFINLHFYGGNHEARDKYKSKINKQISKFCNDYLKRHPSTPIDSEKLCKELYSQLNNVSFLTEDAIRDEVEETQIKDLIFDYANELPLNQKTSADKLQVYRVISRMSKHLHELEKNKDSLENYEAKLKNEIIKWTKKLPLSQFREDNINDFANKLVDEFKRTERSRRFDSTTMNTVDFDLTKGSTAPTQLSQDRITLPRHDDSLTPRLPPRTLNSKDRDHLQKIRERSISGRHLTTSPTRKDAAVSPAPIDAESQTEIRPWEDKSEIQRSPSIQAATQVEQPPHVCQSPTCSLYRPRPCLQSERAFCHITQDVCTKENPLPRQRQTERLLPCDINQPEPGPQDLRSPSCECQPKFIPYSFSPRQSYATPRNFPSPQRHVPNVFRPFQHNSQEDTYATPKRPKRRVQSPPRHQEKPRKTVRPRVIRLEPLEAVKGTGKRPQHPEHDYAIRYFPATNLCGTSSKREVLVSDEEFEEMDISEKLKYRFKERVTSECYGKGQSPSCKDESIKRCPKCCGVECPHPTHLYFSN